VRVFKHTGEIALSVCKSHRNQGIGLLLLEVLIEDIFRNFPELEILTLQVFANNDSGIRLYENFGMEHFLKA
jgi:ribosomal protein S18 acetylase RimI-like enzyme